MKNRNRSIAIIAALGVGLGAGYAIRAVASGIPSTAALTYSGVLETASGPVTGSHSIEVLFYNASTGGTALCDTLTQGDAGLTVTVTNGRFSMPLPDTCATGIASDPNVWVDVIVDGIDTGRTKIGAVPYAVEASHAPLADNATSATTATGALNGVDGGNIASTLATLEAQVATLTTKVNTLSAAPVTVGAYVPCNSTSCSVGYQTPSAWIQSVTRNGVGNYTVNLTPGFFSAGITCAVNGIGTVSTSGTAYNYNTSIAQVLLFSGTTATDMGFEIVCVSPGA